MDLKWEYQKRADEIADEEFGCCFYSLNERTKDVVYGRAIQDVTERLQDNADNMRKEMALRNEKFCERVGCVHVVPKPMKYCSTLCRDKAEGTDYSIVKEGTKR